MTTTTNREIARPRVIVEAVDPTDQHTLYRARCESRRSRTTGPRR